MNATQQNKARMLLTTQAVLATHQNVWQALPAFAEAVAALAQVNGEITQAIEQQTAKSGAVENKSTTLAQLGQSAYEVAAATYACALRAGNPELTQRVAYARREVIKGSQVAVLARCQGILAAATSVQEQLPHYGITAAKLDRLAQRLEAYRLAQTRPRERQASGAAATRALPRLFAQADEIVRGQLDRLAVQFEEEHAGFVNEYESARLIVDVPGGRATEEAEESPALPAEVAQAA